MDRRMFLRFAGGAAAGLLGGASLGMSGSGKRKPNIVLLFIDDMGWTDAGYAGSDFYETPNIDRLSREGVVFTDAYACGANCAPSRACLISGQYTPRHGVFAVKSTDRGPVNQMRLVPVPNRQDLAPENVTVAEALESAGYATGIFGKWHLGRDDAVLPKNQGFQTDYSCDPPSGEDFKRTDDPKRVYDLTEHACRFMEENRDRPFFVYLAHHATHMAIQARRQMAEHFENKQAGSQHSNARFAAMNCHMDDGVGIVLDKLKELGLEENTLVLFASDNGGLPQSSQKPLRGFKGMMYEGGIRVPMIIRWPGKTKAGTKCGVPVANVDFYPTFLEAAGGAIPKGKELDGESLLALLGGGSLKRKSIFWHFPGYLDSRNIGSRDSVFRCRPVSVIRKGDWKLLLYHEEWILDGGRAKIDTSNAVELYNLAEDVSEKKNLASKRVDKRDELLDDLLAWIKRFDAPLPSVPNPKYSPGQAGGGKKQNRRSRQSENDG